MMLFCLTKIQQTKRIQQNIANGSKGRMPYSWFEFNLVKNVSKEKHATLVKFLKN